VAEKKEATRVMRARSLVSCVTRGAGGLAKMQTCRTENTRALFPPFSPRNRVAVKGSGVRTFVGRETARIYERRIGSAVFNAGSTSL